MSTIIEGNITAILDKKEGTSKGGNDWAIQEVVVKTHDNYPQDIKIGFFNDAKIALINDLSIGHSVAIHCNIKGREHNGNYFVSLDGWKVENFSKTTQKTEETKSIPVDLNGDDNDLPF